MNTTLILQWSGHHHNRVIIDPFLHSTLPMRSPDSTLSKVLHCWKPHNPTLRNTIITSSHPNLLALRPLQHLRSKQMRWHHIHARSRVVFSGSHGF